MLDQITQLFPMQFWGEVKHCEEALGQLRGRAIAKLRGNTGVGMKARGMDVFLQYSVFHL